MGLFEAFTEEERDVLFKALEFIEDKYLHPRQQYIRDELLDELAKEEG